MTRTLFLFLTLCLLLSACGTVSKERALPTVAALPTLDVAAFPTSMIPSPLPPTSTPTATRTPLPATWTPVPSRTPAPTRLGQIMIPATSTEFSPPTRTPPPAFTLPPATQIPQPPVISTSAPFLPTGTVWSPPIPITDASFQVEVFGSSQPVLVEYWATWCGYCKSMIPTLEQISSEYYGRMKVVTLDVDQNPGTLSTYGVVGVPTFLLFSNGQLIAQTSGGYPLEDFRNWLRSYIS